MPRLFVLGEHQKLGSVLVTRGRFPGSDGRVHPGRRPVDRGDPEDPEPRQRLTDRAEGPHELGVRAVWPIALKVRPNRRRDAHVVAHLPHRSRNIVNQTTSWQQAQWLPWSISWSAIGAHRGLEAACRPSVKYDQRLIMPDPAYSRLQVDERRRQVVEAGSRLFAEHAFEEISMRQIAEAAGISKALLYHYFPSKIELFKAAVAERAGELERLIEPSGDGTAFEQLTNSLDAYLAWIETNSRAWTKLMQSAATLPEAGTSVEGFRTRTLEQILRRLIGRRKPRPVLRNALNGWLGYVDAAILDWTDAGGLSRDQLRDLIIAAFGAALLAAQQADPKLKLNLG